MKSFNFINQKNRCVSGANLNLFRYAAMVLVLLMLGVGNAWAANYYYARLNGNVANTGGGKVYVATSNTIPSSYTAGTFVEGAKNNTTSKAQQSFFAWAVADDGYAFSSWEGTKATNNNNSAISPSSSSSAEQEFKCNAASGTSNGSSRTDGSSSGYDTYSYYNYTATATFVPVEVNEISATSHTFTSLVNAKKDCNSYKQTITFTTKYADAMADFVDDNAVLTKTEGDGVFSLDGAPSIANNTVTATVKFTGNDRYAATPGGARTNTATLTLTSKGSASQTQTCTFTATFPSASVTSGKLTVSGAESDLYATNTNPVNGNVEFAVKYADALGDFTLPATVTEKSHSGDTWSIGTITGPNTNYETGAGKIVIPITFTSEEGKYGDHTAKITLGGVTVTMTAHVEELADYDVKVVDADGTTVLHKGAWGDDAFSALNGHAGSTLIVGRDFNIGSVSSARAISQNVTLDLNGKAVTATLTAAGSLLSVTSGKTLTITDSKAGGSMQVSGNLNGRISVVEVTNGSLDLQKGDLVAVNSNTGTTKANIYVAGVYLASKAWSGGRPTVTMSMSGGSVTGRRNGASGDYCYGVYCAGTGTNASAVDLNNGTITADFPNGRYAEGVYAAGKSTISNMAITASCKSLSYAIRCEDGQLVVDGGTYVGTTTEGSARGILAINANVLGGTVKAEAGTDHATAIYTYGGTFVVNGGIFTATSGTGKAYAVYVARNNNNIIKVNGGTFSAEGVTEAYGIGFDASNNIVGEISTTAGSFTATASSTAATVKSYGLYLPTGATANIAGTTFKGVTSGNAAVTGSSNNSSPNGAYGIWSSGTLTLTNSTIQGQSAKVYAYGLYTTQPVTMTGTSLSAVTTGANGADHATALFINGSGKTVTANNCSFSAEANTTYAYGVYASAGILESNNSTYSAVTKQTGASAAASSLLRGIYNNSGTTVTLNGGEIACSGNALYSQNAYGIYTAGTATITDVTITCTGAKSGYALYPENTNATMTVNSGMFKGTTAALYINTDKKPKKVELYGGFYSHDTNLKTYKATGCEVYDTPDGSAEKEQGYNFKVADGSNPGVVVAKVYNSSSTLLQSYNTLVEALQFVNANAGTQYTIVMVGDYILPAGDYTVPPQTALVIPDVNTRTKPQGNTPNRVSITTPAPTPFRKLTLVDGAHIAVYGTIETTANQNTSAGGSPLSGAPTGPYGYIQMNAGSTISMENGSNLNSWGYIIGKGEITAQKGSTIREQFQMGYWRGGTATSKMVTNRNSWHAFPVMDYFYQNIEAPITYRPGATAYGYSKVHQSYNWVANDIKLLGTSEAMFLMDNDASEDNTWVRKEYNPATDRVEWTMNSGAKLGNFKFTMAGENINSADYYLPITNNMTITIKDGDCEITQDVILVPGAQLIINKTAKLKVSSGKKLFVVDTEDWKKCGSYYYYKANYSPSWTNPNSNPRTATQMPDAEIFVHGETEGSYYTSTHGANIHSTNEDAGKVKFIAAAGAATSIQQITSTNCDKSQVDFTTAQLKNEKEVNGSYYTSTEGTLAGYAYIYEDQQWVNVLDGCLTTRTDGSGTHYYARPGDNVAVLENDDDAAYHGEQAKDADRNFIFTEKSMTATDAANCVWWEAEKIGDIDGDGKIYYMANKEKYENYGAYYYYKSDVGYWVPRYVSITWSYQVDGTAKSVTYNSVYYHTSPVFAEFTNPHKKDDATYSYAWTGWKDEDGLFYAKDVVLPLATKNTTYTAVFEATRLQGSISFKNYNGGALESRLFDSETIPTCSLTPTRSADVESVYTFDGWSTSAGGNKEYEINGLPAVVKNTSVTYYAHFSASPRPYVITFANYNGDPVQNIEFGYDSHPTYNGADPTRANSGFWSYNFIGWVDKDETFYAKGAELPVVKGVATYTARYEAVDWTPEYTITFKDGDNKVLTTQTARMNVVPEYAGVTPTKAATAQYTYTFNNTWSPAIVAATKNETYTAQFDSELRSYTITFCNETGRELSSATFDYGATPVYGGEMPKKARTGSAVYTFDGWSSTMGGAKLAELPTVTGAATYYAHFSDEPVYVVRFNAQGHGTAPANQEVIRGNKVVEPDALSEIGYTFGGWYKEAGCSNEWNFTSDVVEGTTVLYAKWTANKYKITWWDAQETLENHVIAVEEYEYGDMPSYTYNKPNDYAYSYEVIGWTPNLEQVTADKTYTALYNAIPLTLVVNNEQTISDNVTLNSTTVRVSGALRIAPSASLTTTDLILEAQANTSGEILGNVVANNVYFDLILNTQKRHWRAFTVPFEIDLKQHQILADGVSMPLGVQYDIVYYDGAVRAAQGKVPACWHYVEDDANWILTPGVAYMIVFGRDVNTVRFTKRDEADIAYGGTVSVAENNGASDDVNGGWNGIGNPTTYHALLNAGVTECQVHNGEEIGSDGYITCDMGKFIVGKAVFVQVAASQSVVVNQATSGDDIITPKPQPAPRRAKDGATGKNRFDVQIAPADGQMADRMFLLADEYKEDKYVILQDLAKAGLSTKRAQMWVTRYNTKLCKNTALLVDGTAEYPLGIYAPQAGEYEISIAEYPDEESTLYLTLDGAPIWNLSYAPYIATLEQGTTNRYGLKMVRSNAPTITTDVNNTQAGTQPTAQKIMLDNHVYILRGGELYSITGAKVK